MPVESAVKWKYFCATISHKKVKIRIVAFSLCHTLPKCLRTIISKRELSPYHRKIKEEVNEVLAEGKCLFLLIGHDEFLHSVKHFQWAAPRYFVSFYTYGLFFPWNQREFKICSTYFNCLVTWKTVSQRQVPHRPTCVNRLDKLFVFLKGFSLIKF